MRREMSASLWVAAHVQQAIPPTHPPKGGFRAGEGAFHATRFAHPQKPNTPFLVSNLRFPLRIVVLDPMEEGARWAGLDWGTGGRLCGGGVVGSVWDRRLN